MRSEVFVEGIPYPWHKVRGDIEGPERWSAAMLRKLKMRLQEASGVEFRGLKTFRATFVQQSIDALVSQGFRERAAAEAVMDASGHTKLETVLKHYGRMKRQDSLRLLRQARQARVAEVRKS